MDLAPDNLEPLLPDGGVRLEVVPGELLEPLQGHELDALLGLVLEHADQRVEALRVLEVPDPEERR